VRNWSAPIHNRYVIDESLWDQPTCNFSVESGLKYISFEFNRPHRLLQSRNSAKQNWVNREARMTKYGCCDIRTWPSRSALQEARNTTADQVHQHQHLCWASIHDECTQCHGRPSENGRFLTMLRQVHNTSSVLLRKTTERAACMWKEDTVSCHVILSALALVD
jgi:hypothetical protein